MINLDAVVVGYYRAVTCCYNEMHILQVPHVAWHFAIQLGTMSTGNVHCRCGLTADPRLHIAVDVDLSHLSGFAYLWSI